jgi:hypothetical protein
LGGGLVEDGFEALQALGSAGQQFGSGYFFVADESFGICKFGSQPAFGLEAAHFGHRAAEGYVRLGSCPLAGAPGNNLFQTDEPTAVCVGRVSGLSIEVSGAGGERFLDLCAAAPTPHGVENLSGLACSGRVSGLSSSAGPARRWVSLLRCARR